MQRVVWLQMHRVLLFPEHAVSSVIKEGRQYVMTRLHWQIIAQKTDVPTVSSMWEIRDTVRWVLDGRSNRSCSEEETSPAFVTEARID